MAKRIKSTTDQFKGASQRSLINGALDPENVLLDERSTPELLAFIAGLSRQFWFFDENDKKNGDWRDFFNKDLISLLAVIGQSNKDSDHRKVLDFVQGVQECNVRQDQEDFFQTLFQTIFSAFFEINGWLITLTQYHVNHPFQIYLKEIIWKKLSFTLRNLYGQYYELITADLLQDKERIEQQFRAFRKMDVVWNFNPFPTKEKVEKRSPDFLSDPTSFLNYLRQQIKDFYSLYDSITKESVARFQQNLNSGSIEPHIALILAFLKVYKHQQQGLNDLVPKHLQFYYERMLDFQKRLASGDSGYVLLTLGKDSSAIELPSGTLLSGGVSPTGEPIVFDTAAEVQVLPSEVTQYLTLNYGVYQGSAVKSFRQSLVSGFSTLNVDKNTGKPQTFPIFGNAKGNAVNVISSSVNVGFAISSPELYLEGGTRNVEISFALKAPAAITTKSTKPKEGTKPVDHSGLLNVQLTTSKGWVTLAPGKDYQVCIIEQQLVICLSLGVSAPGITGYEVKKHGPGYDTNWPVFRATLNPNPQFAKGTVAVSPYDFFKSFSFTGYTIKTQVSGLSVLSVSSGAGRLPSAATIMPFGSNPVVGSRLLVGSYEAFIKHTSSLCLNLSWVNLPDQAAFLTYYKAYNDYLKENENVDPVFKWDSYTCDLNILTEGAWAPGATDVPLFEGSSQVDPLELFVCTALIGGVPISNEKSDQKVDNKSKSEQPAQSASYQSNQQITPDYTLKTPLTFSDKSQSGFVSLSMTGPDLSFGNSIYPQVVSKVTLENTMQAALEMGKVIKSLKTLNKIIGAIEAWIKKHFPKSKKKVDMGSLLPKFNTQPNKPLIPRIKDISVTYKAEYHITPGTDVNHQFYQIHPFGTELSSQSENSLLPLYPADNYTCLGFDSLKENTTVSLFLAISDNINMKVSEHFPKLTIEVLTPEGWTGALLMSDSTFGLNKMGIVKFQIPTPPSKENSIMPLGTYWIRLSIDSPIIANCFLSMIGTNAVDVKRVMNSANSNEPIVNLKAGKLTKFVQPVKEISRITQPFATQGGEDPENDSRFYQRVSRRIAQKDRGVSSTDFESLILDRFSEIYSVKIVPGRYLKGGNSRQVKVVVVPLVNYSAIDPYTPIANATTLANVLDCLASRINPQLDLQVYHAHFTEILVEAKVLYKGISQSHELNAKLNADIKDFLSPWISENDLAYTGESLNVTDIIKFINSRSYVASFSQFQLYKDGVLLYPFASDSSTAKSNDVREITPATPLHILISADHHLINADTKEIKAEIASEQKAPNEKILI